MRRFLYSSSGLVFGTMFCLIWGGAVHAVQNGTFETLPNETWLRDGPNSPRPMPGDGAAIVLGTNSNHYGHLGDIDGRGANGENPSRLFQWFRCPSTTPGENSDATPEETPDATPEETPDATLEETPDATPEETPDATDCVIQFRFRALLLEGESAWVRVQSGEGMRAIAIPNSNNRWAAVQPHIVLPGGCGQGINFIDFGMTNSTGSPIGGRLSIDNVTHRCVAAQEVPVDDTDWSDLPGIPLERDAVAAPEVDLLPAAAETEANLLLSILILGGVGLLLIKLRR